MMRETAGRWMVQRIFAAGLGLALAVGAAASYGQAARATAGSQSKPPTPGMPEARATQPKPSDTLPGLTVDQTRFFRYFDRDGDGQIGREEYRNMIVQFFESMDREHHGYVTDAEIRKLFPAVHQGEPLDPKLRMSLTQFEDFMMARFDRADSDHTSKLPPDQFKTLQSMPE